ncbi:dTDP-4-dehydrorhamnose 3,5-epimerase [Natronomonas sp. EA1]|uniref:dTDP-4-dehydrorhamnose 3,5-epimerase n=1 Tax=Natronomonas sp. EA1 TaxID=3421655 RepID=UPI003EB7BE5C
MPFSFEESQIDGVTLIQSEVFEDDRGYLLETFDKEVFEDAGLDTDFILEFYSRSEKGVLRGLHQQADPYQQAKIVRCIRGRIFDVAVDVRKGSETYGQSVSFVLSDENKNAVYIPRGFLHGFLTLSDAAIVHYKADNEYAPQHERGIRWDDPQLDIQWPHDDPIVSEKDESWPVLSKSVYNNK